MSGGSTKREMETSDKATSHGKAPSRESDAKGREGSPPRVKSHQSGDKKKKDEESGILRDRFFVALDIWLRHAVRHF
jgi:hypothetical protein